MANGLIKFVQYLGQKGKTASISAADLDNNFQRLTILPGPGYSVEYTDDGVKLTIMNVPNAGNAGGTVSGGE